MIVEKSSLIVSRCLESSIIRDLCLATSTSCFWLIDLRSAAWLLKCDPLTVVAVREAEDVVPLDVVPVDVLPEARVFELEPEEPVDVVRVVCEPEFELLYPVPELASVEL